MVLVVAGHFNENTVLDVVNLVLKNQTNKSSVKFVQHEQEPLNIKKDIMEFKIHGITSPFFCIGFKETPVKYSESLYCAILDEMLVEILVGQISSTYQELYNKGIINMPLIHESMCRRGYAFNKLSGESENPVNIMVKLKRAIKNAREIGFKFDYFEYCRKALIGRYIFYFDDISILANYMILAHFSVTDIYSLFEYIRHISLEQLEKRLLDAFNLERCAISIVQLVR